MLRHDLPGGCFLRLLEESDAAEIYALVDGNRTYLARWLSWVEATRGADDVLNFIRATRKQMAENKASDSRSSRETESSAPSHSIPLTGRTALPASVTGSPKITKVAGR
jgi:hypothetical protein